METIIIIAILLLILGVIGSILPLLPGLPFSFTGLILLKYYDAIQINWIWFVLLALWIVFLKLLDYFLPTYTTKRMGGSKYAMWGTTLGLLIGIIFSPFGFVSILIFPFLGAFLAEILQKKGMKNSLKVAFGTFIAFLFSNGLSFITSIILLGISLYWLWDYRLF